MKNTGEQVGLKNQLPICAAATAALWVAVFCQLTASQVRAEEAAVAAFKKYLASPPCFSKILFSEVSCSDTVARTFYAGYCRDSFLLRQLTGSEDIDHPINQTNLNRSPLYVGSLGDTRWQIAGYQLTLSVQPNMGSPDNYTSMSDGMQIFLGEILNLGSQHVQPGTFVWTGNKFKAEPSQSARSQGLNNVEGEIAVEGGVVVSMVVQGSGWWHYKYSTNSTNVPFGLPTEITKAGMDSASNIVCISKLRIHQMVVADASQELTLFDPKLRIDPKLTILSVWSNSIHLVKPTPNKLVTEIVMKDLGLQKQAAIPKRQTRSRVLVLFVMAILSGGFALFICKRLLAKK